MTIARPTSRSLNCLMSGKFYARRVRKRAGASSLMHPPFICNGNDNVIVNIFTATSFCMLDNKGGNLSMIVVELA